MDVATIGVATSSLAAILTALMLGGVASATIPADLTIYTEKAVYSRNETITVVGYISDELLARQQNTQDAELQAKVARVHILTPEGAVFDAKLAPVSKAGFFKQDFEIINQRGINFTEIEGEWKAVVIHPGYRGDGMHSSFLYAVQGDPTSSMRQPHSQWLLQDCRRLGIDPEECHTEIISKKVTELLRSEEQQRLESLHDSYWIINFPYEYLIGIGAAIAGIIAFVALRKVAKGSTK